MKQLLNFFNLLRKKVTNLRYNLMTLSLEHNRYRSFKNSF